MVVRVTYFLLALVVLLVHQSTLSGSQPLSHHQQPLPKILTNRGEYAYSADVPLLQVFRKVVPKPAFEMLNEMAKAVTADRDKKKLGQPLRHGKVSGLSVHRLSVYLQHFAFVNPRLCFWDWV